MPQNDVKSRQISSLLVFHTVSFPNRRYSERSASCTVVLHETIPNQQCRLERPEACIRKVHLLHNSPRWPPQSQAPTSLISHHLQAQNRERLRTAGLTASMRDHASLVADERLNAISKCLVRIAPRQAQNVSFQHQAVPRADRDRPERW